MIETLRHDDKASELDILAQSTKKALSEFKKSVLEKSDGQKINLYKKPIQLWYNEINKERKITINLPDEYSAQWRILRCLRRKSATDAVEKKYGIPKWLLLAMMAQEGMWDPTMPNLSGDGGLWLIHIQAVNAANFWLTTLPRYTKNMQDFKHGKEITSVLKKNNSETKKLITYDDRFHPIMWLDCSARFLKNLYNRTESGKDKRINALRKYSWRALNDYLRPVVKYRTLINQYTWEPLPDFSENTNKEIANMKKAWSVSISGVDVPLDIVSKSIQKLSITIDGKPVTYQQYLAYFTWQVQNYWLNTYIISKSALLSPNKKTAEKIENFQYLKKSKDGKRLVYKYTIPSDNYATDPKEFLTLAKLRNTFAWKIVQLTDENGLPINPLNFPKKKWNAVYIKEKII